LATLLAILLVCFETPSVVATAIRAFVFIPLRIGERVVGDIVKVSLIKKGGGIPYYSRIRS
jgi:hypothetical protein